MDTIKLETQGEKLIVKAPFHPEMSPKARDLGGKWDSKQSVWTFDPRDEQAVREMLIALFGTDGSPVATTTVLHEVTTKEAAEPQLWLCGRKVAERVTRDSKVRLGQGVRYSDPEKMFPERGGSAKYPALEGTGVVLEIRDVPVTFVGGEISKEETKSPLADVDTSVLIAELERRGYWVSRQ